MRRIGPNLLLGTLCIGICVLLLLHPRERSQNTSPILQSAGRSQTFQRVPPTPLSPQTISTLVTELHDSSPLVRERAAAELGDLGVEAFDALPDLKRLADNDPDEQVRRSEERRVGKEG